MTQVSVGTPARIVLETLDNIGTENLSEIQPQQIPGRTKIFVNGSWVGITGDAETVVNN